MNHHNLSLHSVHFLANSSSYEHYLLKQIL